jgi:hypothetical protein
MQKGRCRHKREEQKGALTTAASSVDAKHTHIIPSATGDDSTDDTCPVNQRQKVCALLCTHQTVIERQQVLA